MELIDIVRKLIGPIQPIGESNTDAKRLENLSQYGELLDGLLCDLEETAIHADRAEASMRLIGQKAKTYLSEVKSA